MKLNFFKKQYWNGQRLLLLTILFVHTAASFYYISRQNITFDEPQYIEYAKRWLHGRPERTQLMDDSKSPIIAICWVPRIVRQIIQPEYHLTDYGRKDQEEGRYMMIFFSLVTAMYMYWWCKDWYGEKGWILPLIILLFDPLYLAYSTLITTDLPCATFLLAVLFHFRKYVLHKNVKQLYISAFLTALAIVTKQTLLFLVILLPSMVIVRQVIHLSLKEIFSYKSLLPLLIFGAIVLFTINLSYYFNQTGIAFGDYVFESQSLQAMQQSLSIFHNIPVPFPKAFIQSIDMIKAHAELGADQPNSTYNGVYLFEQIKLKGNYWYYYIVMLFYKMPIGTMLLLLGSLVLLVKKFKPKPFADKYLFLILPILFFGILLSFFNQFQIGVRHILLIFPLLYIGVGKLFMYASGQSRLVKYFPVILVVYSLISVATYYPYIIPYTNEFIGDKKFVYKKILDTSIDYGQSDSSIHTFIIENPAYKRGVENPSVGHYAVSMNEIINYPTKKCPFAWYHRFTPIGVYRHVVLLYDIKEEDLKTIKQ